MINYIREYGISLEELEQINKKLSKTDIEMLVLHETEVRKVLNLYKEANLSKELCSLFMNRLDLILIPIESLRSMLSNVDVELFKLMLKNNINDLIVLGV